MPSLGRERPPGRATRLALASALAIALLLSGASSALALTEASFVEKAQTTPTLVVSGETLTWQAVDATRGYVLQRTIPGREPEFALVRGTYAIPPPISGKAVVYRVRPATAPARWSQEVTIRYPLLPLESTVSTLLESSFVPPAAGAPKVDASGETLAWNAVDLTGAYLIRRTLPGGLPEFALVKALQATPPAIPGSTVGYRVKPLTGGTYSAEDAITYPEEGEGEPPSGEGSVVNALPTGPPAPSSGWKVAYADAFGAPIGTEAGEDNTWKAGYNNQGCCGNWNEINIERPSQASVTLEGLKLKCQYLATEVSGKHYNCGGITGRGAYKPPLLAFRGETLAVEWKGKLPPNLGTADPGVWSYGTAESEFDFLEAFGWSRGYTKGWTTSTACLGCWFFWPHPELDKEGFNALQPPNEPENTEHAYTTYIYPTSGGGYRYSTYIDGVRQLLEYRGNDWELLEKSPEVTPNPEVRNHLVITYALRAAEGHANGFTSGSNTMTVRSLAVYIDGAHAGSGAISHEGIAPGTTVK